MRRLRDEVAGVVVPAFTPRTLSRRLRGHCLIFEQCLDHFLGIALLLRPIVYIVVHALTTEQFGSQSGSCTLRLGFADRSVRWLCHWLNGQVDETRTRTDRFTACDATITTRTCWSLPPDLHWPSPVYETGAPLSVRERQMVGDAGSAPATIRV